MRLFIGNLPHSYNEDKVREIFAEHGEIDNVAVPTDRYTNKPRGFAFVEMPNDEEAKAAIEAVHGTEHDGRELRVEEARPQRERGGRGGGFNRNRGGGGYNRDRW
ncbi:RNA-binding protein [candidate division WOR-3 bacterium]|uniref:RNA-binding protein n=1 Tax=candidate division WOR-3 bacterium TaxID=2052148 RepID=A0A9D5KAS5_UNCW3|nr:RNA-binding protein [candidate division WOR-3 bacterium]MBD3364705.1 RNA-binding protein [candidate division WOR-3 bacterium]